VARMRRSMNDLTLQYNAARMVRAYLDQAYLPAARALRERIADGGAAAQAMAAWDRRLRRGWPGVHIGAPDVSRQDDGWIVSVPVYLGEIAVADVRVEGYAESRDGEPAEIVALEHDGPIPGAAGGYFYRGRIPGPRPAEDYTMRVVPAYPGVRVPAENALIRWQR
jgi:starch phosphorylase